MPDRASTEVIHLGEFFSGEKPTILIPLAAAVTDDYTGEVAAQVYGADGDALADKTTTSWNESKQRAEVTILLSGLPAGEGYRLKVTITLNDGDNVLIAQHTFDLVAPWS